jgi:hypothetical protein
VEEHPGKRPVYHFVTENGKEIPRIYGAFVQGKVPKCPAEMYDVEGDFPIHQT